MLGRLVGVLPKSSIVFLFAALFALGGLSFAQTGGIGFQARLDTPSRVVSAYDDPDHSFSAALSPQTYSPLTDRLIFTPKVNRSGIFADTALSFETKIRGKVGLVPVSVAGLEYNDYRTRSAINREFGGFASNTLVALNRGARREGLNIGVDLPKRFNQMFGEGGANLRVTGYRRITFSGRSQWDDKSGSGIHQQNRFPALNMEQISRFTIQGTIGTKISVSVSQDNQTDIPLANRLILRYKGDEDDIIKTLEAGNTTLSIANTRFVGYSQRIQGLFGLKAEAQLGNLKLIAIASQEKGSSESAVVSASGEENADYIRDYNYVEGRIFDLFYSSDDIGPYDEVNIEIWEEETRTDNTEAKEVYLKVRTDQAAGGPYDNSLVRMKDITADDGWELLYGQDTLYGRDPTRSPVALYFSSGKRRAIGVHMVVTHLDKDGKPTLAGVDTIGHKSKGTVEDPMDTLRVVMPMSKDLYPANPAWHLMWRNCYRVPRNLATEDIDLKIFMGTPGREGVASNLDYQQFNGVSEDSYLQIFGLDQVNNTNISKRIPDGKLDPFQTIHREDWGLVIFPDRRPFEGGEVFDYGGGEHSDELRKVVEDIYEYSSRSEKLQDSKYYLQVSTKLRSATIRLGRANIIEGSERVTADGALLTKGTDYNISYDMGQVTLISTKATAASADVQVEFQYAPFMALQKKTLLGTRFEYEYSQDLKFGATVLYKSDKAQERKPRVGQETAKAMVLDFDISFSLHPNFLTRVIDAIPLINTEAASLLRVSAEIAQSRPNPNVNGAAYVDDFESAEELVSLGMVRTNWTLSSEPLGINPDSSSRGTIRWHNPPPVPREDVYAGDVAIGRGTLQPLRLIYRPRETKPCDTLAETKSWGGIMRPFASRLDEKRILTFKVRAKGGRGTLHFDFGHISEDANGNGYFEMEDRGQVHNGTLEPDGSEDTGLDTLMDAMEFGPCGDGDTATVDNPDPAGDNWWYNGFTKDLQNAPPPVSAAFYLEHEAEINDPNHWMHYEWQNGTEGNAQDDAVQGRPDEEGPTRQRVNSYYTFALPLDAYDSDGKPNKFLANETSFNGWYTYEIPVRDPDILTILPEIDEGLISDSTGEALTVSWSSVTHARVWFEKDTVGMDSLVNMDSVVIADWGFVQSSWHDTLLTVGVDPESDFYTTLVSEDDSTFIHPPGVESYVDPVTNVEESQRGLALRFTNLRPQTEGVALKELFTTEAYSGYRKLEMYVHGPDDIKPSDRLWFYLRLGLDSLNYYEYRSLLEPGWTESNNVLIDFNEITALKDAANQALEDRYGLLEDSTDVYRVVGRPNIAEVRFISASVKNHGPENITGEVWIDELRVTDVRKDVGNAARVSVNGSLADLVTYNFTYEHRDAYFRGLSQATRGGSKNNLGSGQETNVVSAGGTLNVSKFLPRSWTARLPLTYSYSESEAIPLLRNNSDVVLPEEVRELEKSTSRAVKVSTSESFQKKGSNLLFNAFLNRQKITMSYSRSHKKNVSSPLIFVENYNMKAEYNMGVATPPSVPLFGWAKSIPLMKKMSEMRLALYPSKWRWDATFNRSLQVKDDIDYNRTSSFSRTFNGRMDMAYRPFSSLSIDFNLGTKRDLTDPELVNLSLTNAKLGLENSYNQSLRISYDPKIVTFLTSAVSYSAAYTDSYNRSTFARSTSLTKNWSLSGDFRHALLLGTKQRKRTRPSGGRRGTVRGGVRPVPEEPEDGVKDDDKDSEKDKEPGTPIYEPILDGLRFMTNWLQPVRYRYTEGFNRSIPGALEKLPWRYRLGLDAMAEFPTISSSRNPSMGESVAYELSSGFSLLGGITTTVGYKTSINRSLTAVGTDRTEGVSISWPEVSLQIRRFTTLPLLKPYVNWFIDVFSPRTSYSRQVKKTENLDRGFTITETETINRSPVLSLNLKLLQRLSLTGSYNVTKTVEERNDRSSGVAQGETHTTKESIALATKFSFSAPGGIKIPLLGRLKFKSMVSIDFSIQYASNLVEKSGQGSPFTPFTNTSSFSASPVISYSFSSKIRGGISARWQDTNDLQRNKKSHVREIQLWTEIRF